MTGADIVGALLRDYASLIEMIAAPRIKLGDLPDDIVLPALLVRQTSSVDRHPLSHEAKIRITDRVSVTVHAKS